MNAMTTFRKGRMGAVGQRFNCLARTKALDETL